MEFPDWRVSELLLAFIEGDSNNRQQGFTYVPAHTITDFADTF